MTATVAIAASSIQQSKDGVELVYSMEIHGCQRLSRICTV